VTEKLSVIIPVQSGCDIQTDLSSCPFDNEVIVVRNFGIGQARSVGASTAKAELIVMLDSDLVVTAELWTWLSALKKGTFAMTKNPGRASYSSKIFAIHKDDYLKIGGFDSSLRYLWEDGEFALRASALGFKVAPVPPSMYLHIEHQSRCLNKQYFVYFNWEYARLFVKFRKRIYPNLTMWFFDMLNLRKRQFNFQPTMVRLSGFFFWNLKSLVSPI
jgi:glycosyltransferase involved in cell wall biosynthesis